jgi:hypothetical protein
MWQIGALEDEIQPAWLEALQQTHDWYEPRREKNFRPLRQEEVLIDGVKTVVNKDSNEINFGWLGVYFDTELQKKMPCLNLMKEPFEKMLIDNDKDYKATVDSWLSRGLISEGERNISKKTGKVGKPRPTVNAKRGTESPRVIQLKLYKVSELLGLETKW